MVFFFGLGKLFYGSWLNLSSLKHSMLIVPVIVIILLLNAISILSEDRFLARGTVQPC